MLQTESCLLKVGDTRSHAVRKGINGTTTSEITLALKLLARPLPTPPLFLIL